MNEDGGPIRQRAVGGSLLNVRTQVSSEPGKNEIKSG
jgi:hypothetical protein